MFLAASLVQEYGLWQCLSTSTQQTTQLLVLAADSKDSGMETQTYYRKRHLFS